MNTIYLPLGALVVVLLVLFGPPLVMYFRNKKHNDLLMEEIIAEYPEIPEGQHLQIVWGIPAPVHLLPYGPGATLWVYQGLAKSSSLIPELVYSRLEYD